MTKNISKIHREILDKNRQELLEKLLLFTTNFILGGGTALALQLNHRMSYDFDFFSKLPIEKNLLEKISHKIPIAAISVDSSDELTFFTKNSIKVTFLYYPFKDLFPIQEFDNNLRIFSLQDIAIKKAYTIGRRGEYRDYFDLYCILKNNYLSLTELIKDTKKIYGSIFEEKIFLQQLVYFNDLRNFEIIPIVGKKLSKPDEVKKFLEEQVKKVIKL